VGSRCSSVPCSIPAFAASVLGVSVIIEPFCESGVQAAACSVRLLAIEI
jgi:hypothetical protein